MSIQQNQQEIAEAEADLQDLGITQDIFAQALQALVKRRNAQQNIKRIQQNQFYDDAFRIINLIHNTDQGDRVVAVSRKLRLFAEYVAAQVLVLQATYADVETIVDNIPPFGGDN